MDQAPPNDGRMPLEDLLRVELSRDSVTARRCLPLHQMPTCKLKKALEAQADPVDSAEVFQGAAGVGTVVLKRKRAAPQLWPELNPDLIPLCELIKACCVAV